MQLPTEMRETVLPLTVQIDVVRELNVTALPDPPPVAATAYVPPAIAGIGGEDKKAWFAADLIPMSAHIPLAYIMSYDLLPLTTLEEKKRFLKQALDEQWITIFEHDPHVPACRITVDEKGNYKRGPDLII